MPIGTSDGNVYEDEMHHALGIPSVPVQQIPGRLIINPKVGTEGGDETQTVHVFRHGDISLKDNHGWSPAPLNAEGENHADMAADKANKLDLDVLYTSDLPRTMQTADAIANKTAMQPIPTEALRTWDIGAYTGKTDPASIEAVNRLCTNALNEAPPSNAQYQGESFNDFKNRVIGAVGGILQQHPGQEVGFVTHNSFEKVLRAWDVAGQKPNGKLDMDEFHKENIKPGGHVAMDLDAQAAREVAANKMIGSTVRAGAAQPNTALARQQAQEFMQPIKESFKDFIKNPENIVGTGELTGAFGGPIGASRLVAKTANLNLAKSLEEIGHTAKEIFQKTGWYRDADEHWKFVIPGGRLKTENLQYHPATPGKGWESVGGQETYSVPGEGIPGLKGKTKLKDIYDNPELYLMYPSIGMHDVSSIPLNFGGVLGEYHRPSNINPQGALKFARQQQPDILLSVIEHEVQHAVQRIEGFPTGGSSGMFAPSNMRAINDLLKGREQDLKSQFYAEGNFWNDDQRIMESAFMDAKYLSKKVTSGNPDEYKSFNDYMVGAYDKFTSPERRRVTDIFRKNPDLLEDFIQFNKWENDKQAIQDEMHKRYEALHGEVEARNAQAWAAYDQDVGKTPRDTAQLRVPEDERIRREDMENPGLSEVSESRTGKTSNSENPKGKLTKAENARAIEELRKQGRSRAEMADILNISPITLERYITDFGLASKAQTKYPEGMTTQERRNLYMKGYNAGKRGKELNQWILDQFK